MSFLRRHAFIKNMRINYFAKTEKCLETIQKILI